MSSSKIIFAVITIEIKFAELTMLQCLYVTLHMSHRVAYLTQRDHTVCMSQKD